MVSFVLKVINGLLWHTQLRIFKQNLHMPDPAGTQTDTPLAVVDDSGRVTLRSAAQKVALLYTIQKYLVYGLLCVCDSLLLCKSFHTAFYTQCMKSVVKFELANFGPMKYASMNVGGCSRACGFCLFFVFLFSCVVQGSNLYIPSWFFPIHCTWGNRWRMLEIEIRTQTSSNDN